MGEVHPSQPSEPKPFIVALFGGRCLLLFDQLVNVDLVGTLEDAVCITVRNEFDSRLSQFAASLMSYHKSPPSTHARQ